MMSSSPCSNLSIDWLTFGTIAFVGMFAGAFGAHGLERRAGITAKELHAWNTASNYAVWNPVEGLYDD